MATDSDTAGLHLRRAGRRGFLIGVTLAELMLITLFVLLLLLEGFGQLEEDLGGRESVDAVRALAASVRGWAEEQERSLPEVWRNLLPRNEKLTETDRDRAFRRLAEERKQRDEVESELMRARAQVKELKDKVGGLVLCAYDLPATPDARHGKSVALGTVHLQRDGITLIHKRVGLRKLEVVDKVGDPYDLTDALDQLDSWLVGTKRTFDEFRDWGEAFVRIGDRESERRQKCRFSMGFYIDEGVHSDVLTDVFERYFFKQPLNSISKQEYQRLIGTGANADTR